jgi:starch synthase
MQFEPDILHCNDWQTGMMPLLLDAHYKTYGIHTNMKTVFTIHNLKYQGVHGIDTIKDLLDLPDRFLTKELSVTNGAVNFLMAGIVFSNSVTTVSPTYAYEIMTDYYGEGLNGVLQKYAYKVSGILNGIDGKEYNPVEDGMIPQKYSLENYTEGKAACKRAIQLQLGLSENPGAPLLVMISRLVDQKGLDLLLRVLEEMLYDGMQVVILGTGDTFYEKALSDIARKSPEKMCACISFDNGLAHSLYAGADIYLMPSLFEPCGLSQMIAMSYGTLPVARETGGLKDTVIPYNQYTNDGNGFTFANINAHEFLFTTKYACDLYRNHRDVWNHLIENAMKGDYSWDRSAKEYGGLYSLITGIPIDIPSSETEAGPVMAAALEDTEASLNPEQPATPIQTDLPVQPHEDSPEASMPAKTKKAAGTRAKKAASSIAEELPKSPAAPEASEGTSGGKVTAKKTASKKSKKDDSKEA